MVPYELTSMLCLLRIGSLFWGLVNSKLHYIAFENFCGSHSHVCAPSDMTLIISIFFIVSWHMVCFSYTFFSSLIWFVPFTTLFHKTSTLFLSFNYHSLFKFVSSICMCIFSFILGAVKLILEVVFLKVNQGIN
jgi:hypothetical protein